MSLRTMRRSVFEVPWRPTRRGQARGIGDDLEPDDVLLVARRGRHGRDVNIEKAIGRSDGVGDRGQ